MSVASEIVLAAVQMARVPAPPPTNPYHRHFDLAALDDLVEAQTAKALSLFDQAGRRGASLVLGGEDLQWVSGLLPLPTRIDFLRRYTHRIPGPLTERIAAVARRHGMYLGACFFERSGARHYNTAVLFDPRGRIVGKYRKVHLPPAEACVLDAGHAWPVFRTALGRVGFAICYDMMFVESARCLALGGADLILHPTAGYGWTEAIGDVQSRARAIDNDVAVVIACRRRSQIVNAWGDVLADAGPAPDAIVTAALDPRGHRVFREGFFHRVSTGARSGAEEHYRQRLPAAYGLLTRASPPVVAARPALLTPARKAFIRRLMAREYQALAAGRRGPTHWNAR